MKSKRFLLKFLSLTAVLAVSVMLFAGALASLAESNGRSVTLSTDSAQGTDWVIEVVETNYAYNFSATVEEKGTVYAIKSGASGLYLTAAFDGSGKATLTTETRDLNNAGQRWMLRVPWNDANNANLAYALINFGYTYEDSGKQVPAMLLYDLTVQKLNNGGDGSWMWCINGGNGKRLPASFTSYTTKLFSVWPSNYLCEEAGGSSEPYVKQNDVEVIKSGSLTEWVFEKAGIDSYTDNTGNSRSNQQLYTIKSKATDAYLTAVYAADGSVSFETGSRDTANKGQLWSLYRANGWGGFYNLINFGKTQTVNGASGSFTTPTQLDTNGTALLCSVPQAMGSGNRSWFLNGAQNTLESLIQAQGTTDGSFTATLATQWPTLYFSEIVKAEGRTAAARIKSSAAADFSLSGVDKDDAYIWDVNYQTNENNRDYYTLYHRGTGLYLSIRDGKPVLAERDEFDTTQLWYLRDCSTYGNQLASWNNIYEIRSYDNTKAIHTVESGGVALEETELRFSDTTSYGEQGGRGWTLTKNRTTKTLAKQNVCVINSYQWGKGGNYYLYAPVYRPLQSVSLNLSTLSLVPGGSAQLTYTLNPTDATDAGEPVWSSDNPAVAAVDSKGNVTTGQLGTAKVTVTVGDKSAVCTVTVADVNVSGVTLDRDKLSLTAGATYTLTAAITPADATQSYTMAWESNDPAVASVDAVGKITAHKGGEATITCKVTTSDGVYTAICTVAVPMKGITSVSLSKETLDVILGDSATLQYTVAPEDHTVTEVNAVFTSDNPDVATVDANGLVKAVGIGQATITVTVNDLYTDTCVITVVHRGIEKLILSKTALQLTAGTSDTLTVEILPENTTVDKNVLWSSSRPAVAIVTGGKVTAIKPGSAEITATVGGVSVQCHVTVTSVEEQPTTVTWQGTLLDTNGNALAGHRIAVREKTAYTDGSGRFTLSDIPTGAITAEVYTGEGELLLTKGLMIEKGAADGINGSVVTVAGTVMRLSLQVSGATAELLEYTTAQDEPVKPAPTTGDTVKLVLPALCAVCSLGVLLGASAKEIVKRRKATRP